MAERNSRSAYIDPCGDEESSGECPRGTGGELEAPLFAGREQGIQSRPVSRRARRVGAWHDRRFSRRRVSIDQITVWSRAYPCSAELRFLRREVSSECQDQKETR